MTSSKPTSQLEAANMAETQIAFQPGDVVRYTPKDHWCRHGIAVVHENGGGRDTYWRDGDGSYVSPAALAGGDLMFRMGDVRPVNDEREWAKYAEADRHSFPMGAYPRTLFVRADAEPDLETQIQNAYGELRKAEEDLKSAGHRIQWAGRDIALLEAKRA